MFGSRRIQPSPIGGNGYQTIATGPREERNQETDGEGEAEGRHACGQTGTRNAREEVFPPLFHSFTSGQEQGSHLVSGWSPL